MLYIVSKYSDINNPTFKNYLFLISVRTGGPVKKVTWFDTR